MRFSALSHSVAGHIIPQLIYIPFIMWLLFASNFCYCSPICIWNTQLQCMTIYDVARKINISKFRAVFCALAEIAKRSRRFHSCLAAFLPLLFGIVLILAHGYNSFIHSLKQTQMCCDTFCTHIVARRPSQLFLSSMLSSANLDAVIDEMHSSFAADD